MAFGIFGAKFTGSQFLMNSKAVRIHVSNLDVIEWLRFEVERFQRWQFVDRRPDFRGRRTEQLDDFVHLNRIL